MTTNNHPAHGPVSLERLHQISEILSKAAAQSDGGNLGYAMADAVKEINGVIAARNAKPVAWQFKAVNGEWISISGTGKNQAASEGCEIRQLYTTPPAPLVPDEIEPDSDNTYDYVDGWNACRVAMLQDNQRDLSQPIDPQVAKYEQIMLQAGNSPVTPDGWIPVSERMPEGSEEVLCTKEFDGTGDWRKKVGYWLAGKWTVYGASWTPTHWMPLPAAPKQTEG
ncbi:DUF551 domain-containing protein [Salmonella enterica]|nr:DUF551 domain-containing protein [Salmonella enterica]